MEKTANADNLIEAGKQKRFNELLAQKTITLQDIAEKLQGRERNQFFHLIHQKVNEVKGLEREEFISKIEPCLPENTKDQLWEHDQCQITWAMSALIQDYGRMPAINEISGKAGIAVSTVTKHLKNYSQDPRHLETIEQFQFMKDKVLAKVFTFAVQGNIAAAKLYLDVVGDLDGTKKGNTTENIQNNYIQINQIKLSQDTLLQLNSEQLAEIEAVLNKVIVIPQLASE